MRPKFLACVFAALILAAWLLLRFRPENAIEPPGQGTASTLELIDGLLCRSNDRHPFSGFFVEHYETGKLKSRSEVATGQLHGLSEGWHTNGVLAVRERFDHGVSHGLREKWGQNGKKLSEAGIAHGKLNGLFQSWHPNGAVAERVLMKDGEPNGAALSFYPSGFLKSEALLEHGKVLVQKSWADGQQKL